MKLFPQKTATPRAMSSRFSAVAAAVICFVMPWTATASDDRYAADFQTAKHIEKLIQELDSNNYQLRQQATRRLYKMGRAAVGPLWDAARVGSLEQAARAVRVLKELHRGDDAGVRGDAEQALESLKRSPRRAVARRAAMALKANAQWRRQSDPAVVAAAYWSEVRAQSTGQLESSQLEVRDTMEEMRRMSAAGLSPADDPQLIQSLRASARRMGRARMGLVRGAIHEMQMPNAN